MPNLVRFLLVVAATLCLGEVFEAAIVPAGASAEGASSLWIACCVVVFITLCALAPWRHEPEE